MRGKCLKPIATSLAILLFVVSAPARVRGQEPSDPVVPSAIVELPSAETAQAQMEDAFAGEEPVAGAAQEAESDARLRDLLSLVKDNTTEIRKRENPAYFALIKKVMDEAPEQLRTRMANSPRFNELYKSPSKYRGQLVHVSLNARLVIPYEIKVRNVANVTRLYEIWGWTEQAKSHMYCCVVPELPAGFPTEGEISRRVELTGYFFKLQAYQPGNAQPNAPNLVAPLILGRIVEAPTIAKKEAEVGYWPLMLIVGFGMIVMFRVMMHVRGIGRTAVTHRNYRRRSLEPIDADALTDSLDEFSGRGLRIRNANEA